MKIIRSLIAVAGAAVFAVPALSFAQSNQPLTRAEVRAQLVELQKAGYHPAGDESQYPANIEAAEARLDAASSYGPSAAGSSASGSRVAAVDVVGLDATYTKP
ncbi:DUF4148 domain-containing protein [Paraburkholderia phymatum]|uniref:DUF4148 domain-containing protein n=1 Tax=Paraburkholderia phymatum TaxID=148447 RepID=A0ACC6U2W5_9BURK